MPMPEPSPQPSMFRRVARIFIWVHVAVIALIVLIVMVTQLVTSQPRGPAADDSAALSRIKPVGEVVLATASGPKGGLAGDEVYAQVCKNCHEAGLAGAPKFGDKAAWGKIIAQGPEPTFQHAIAGIRAMPPRGGNPDLTDDEVKRAVAHMANAAGAQWKAPAPSATAQAAGRSGEQIVEAACARCHASGAQGAPRIGDASAWTRRVSNRGLDSVVQSAMRGHGNMPARGGMAELSDAEVRSAVEFMVNRSVGAGAPAAAAAAAPAAAPTPAAGATAAAAPASAPAKADGKQVYDSTCMACHAAGIAGAPKLGDKAAWAPRLKQGADTLYASALKGKGAMPPKGGNMALPDESVKAAVDFMTASVK